MLDANSCVELFMEAYNLSCFIQRRHKRLLKLAVYVFFVQIYNNAISHQSVLLSVIPVYGSGSRFQIGIFCEKGSTFC